MGIWQAPGQAIGMIGAIGQALGHLPGLGFLSQLETEPVQVLRTTALRDVNTALRHIDRYREHPHYEAFMEEGHVFCAGCADACGMSAEAKAHVLTDFPQRDLARLTAIARRAVLRGDRIRFAARPVRGASRIEVRGRTATYYASVRENPLVELVRQTIAP